MSTVRSLQSQLEAPKPPYCGVIPMTDIVHRYMQHVDAKVRNIITSELNAVGAQVRKSVIIPFCDRMGCDYRTSNGSYGFWLRYELPPERSRLWVVGDDRRPLPGNPGGIEGDEDKWWAEVTDEERRIKELLESRPEWGTGPLCWFVEDYRRGV